MNDLAIRLNGSSSLQSYLQYIGNIPRLSEEEERQLIQEMCHKKCKQAAHKIILHHLKFVAFLARKYEHWGFPLQDLIQEGNVALMIAVSKYDPVKANNAKMTTFSVKYIISAFKEYVRRNLKMFCMATTKPVKKALNNLHKYSHFGGTLTDNQADRMALDLNITVNDIRLAEQQSHTMAWSFEVIDGEEQDIQIEDDRYSPTTLLEMYEEPRTIAEEVQMLLGRLIPADREIIERRYLATKPALLSELAAEKGVSQQRIAQREKRALVMMRA